jgi:hypothetical protein
MTEDTLNARLARWFQGHEAAQDFALQWWTVCQEWDDLEDEGRCDDMNALLQWLAFDCHRHPWMQTAGPLMMPVLDAAVQSWRVANVLDRGDRDDVSKSYVLRAWPIYGVWLHMARLIGGSKWAADVGPEVWRTYGETAEGLWKEMQDA